MNSQNIGIIAPMMTSLQEREKVFLKRLERQWVISVVVGLLIMAAGIACVWFSLIPHTFPFQFSNQFSSKDWLIFSAPCLLMPPVMLYWCNYTQKKLKNLLRTGRRENCKIILERKWTSQNYTSVNSRNFGELGEEKTTYSRVYLAHLSFPNTQKPPITYQTNPFSKVALNGMSSETPAVATAYYASEEDDILKLIDTPYEFIIVRSIYIDRHDNLTTKQIRITRNLLKAIKSKS